MEDIVTMTITAFVTIIGGILWNFGWKKDDLIGKVFGFFLLALASWVVIKNFHIF